MSFGSGDPTRELSHRFVMSMLTISRDPDVQAWLERPRSRVVRLCAFLVGCAIAGIVWWRWHAVGLMALGYLSTPILGPIVAAGPASRLARKRRPDTPRFRGSTAAIPFYLLAGAASVVCTAGFVPSVWRATGNYILIGPLIAVLFAVVFTPMFLVLEFETRREERPIEMHPLDAEIAESVARPETARSHELAGTEPVGTEVVSGSHGQGEHTSEKPAVEEMPQPLDDEQATEPEPEPSPGPKPEYPVRRQTGYRRPMRRAWRRS